MSETSFFAFIPRENTTGISASDIQECPDASRTGVKTGSRLSALPISVSRMFIHIIMKRGWISKYSTPETCKGRFYKFAKMYTCLFHIHLYVCPGMIPKAAEGPHPSCSQIPPAFFSPLTFSRGRFSFISVAPRLYCVLISPTISSRDRVAIYSYPSAISSGEILIPVLIHSTTTNVIAFA